MSVLFSIKFFLINLDFNLIALKISVIIIFLLSEKALNMLFIMIHVNLQVNKKKFFFVKHLKDEYKILFNPKNFKKFSVKFKKNLILNKLLILMFNIINLIILLIIIIVLLSIKKMKKMILFMMMILMIFNFNLINIKNILLILLIMNYNLLPNFIILIILMNFYMFTMKKIKDKLCILIILMIINNKLMVVFGICKEVLKLLNLKSEILLYNYF